MLLALATFTAIGTRWPVNSPSSRPNCIELSVSLAVQALLPLVALTLQGCGSGQVEIKANDYWTDDAASEVERCNLWIDKNFEEGTFHSAEHLIAKHAPKLLESLAPQDRNRRLEKLSSRLACHLPRKLKLYKEGHHKDKGRFSIQKGSNPEEDLQKLLKDGTLIQRLWSDSEHNPDNHHDQTPIVRCKALIEDMPELPLSLDACLSLPVAELDAIAGALGPLYTSMLEQAVDHRCVRRLVKRCGASDEYFEFDAKPPELSDVVMRDPTQHMSSTTTWDLKQDITVTTTPLQRQENWDNKSERATPSTTKFQEVDSDAEVDSDVEADSGDGGVGAEPSGEEPGTGLRSESDVLEPSGSTASYARSLRSGRPWHFSTT